MFGALPAVGNREEFDRIARNEALLRPGAEALCAALGFKLGARFAAGSLPVYGLDRNLVLKLYPPVHDDERVREVAMLGTLAGRLPIATPAVERSGTVGAWGYLVMSRLPGEPMSSTWSAMSSAERERLAEELGGALAVLHSLREPRLAAVCDQWERFVAEQRETAVARQKARGLAAHWLEQIPDLLQRVTLPSVTTDALLHTEIMRDHVLVQPSSKGYVLSGLVDFEPSMLGAPEYEFASVGVFFSCGDARLLRHLLVGYGYRPSELDAALSHRLLVYGLLHRYSNFPWYIERLALSPTVRTFEALAEAWWGVA